MRRKNQKPPICIGGLEKLRAMDRPRYMNVPLPAPCHVNVAGVGKQSVWGLRIIDGTQLSLWHHSANSSIQKMATPAPFLTARTTVHRARLGLSSGPPAAFRISSPISTNNLPCAS